MVSICLDTGVLSIFFSNSPTPEVIRLFAEIKNQIIDANIPKEVLIEEFHQLCKIRGVDKAKSLIMSLIEQYPIHLVDLTTPLILKAGTLKCQNKDLLSYIDCICIAYALNMKIFFHTTEKTLTKIPQILKEQLHVVKYKF